MAEKVQYVILATASVLGFLAAAWMALPNALG